MVHAMINIREHTNRILNILKDKSEAIDLMAHQYESEVMEPGLRPEYIGKAKKIMEQDAIKVGTLEEFRKRYGLE